MKFAENLPRLAYQKKFGTGKDYSGSRIRNQAMVAPDQQQPLDTGSIAARHPGRWRPLPHRLRDGEREDPLLPHSHDPEHPPLQAGASEQVGQCKLLDSLFKISGSLEGKNGYGDF